MRRIHALAPALLALAILNAAQPTVQHHAPTAAVAPDPSDTPVQWTIVITGTGPCFSNSPDSADILAKHFVTTLLAHGQSLNPEDGNVATLLVGPHHLLLEE